MTNAELMKELQKPFYPDEIEFRVGSTNKEKTKGLALAYVTNRAIQDRLDNIFGPYGWKNEFREWKQNSQLCGISVKVDDEWITKWDGADDSNMEATKGGLSDAMKRAAYQWGIGRYLYKLPDVWVPLKDGKYLEHEPKLPSWALPEGYTYTESKPDKQPPKTNPEPPKQEQKTDDAKPKCADCGKEISVNVHDYSAKQFGKPYCMDCQKNHKAG
jgi:hypothetical protein